MPRKDQEMNENMTERVRFERCHDKLVDRAKEAGAEGMWYKEYEALLCGAGEELF